MYYTKYNIDPTILAVTCYIEFLLIIQYIYLWNFYRKQILKFNIYFVSPLQQECNKLFSTRTDMTYSVHLLLVKYCSYCKHLNTVQLYCNYSPKEGKFIRWIQNIAPHPLKTKLYTVHAIWMHNGHIWCQIVKIFTQYSRQIKIQHKAFNMHNDVT